MSSRPSRSSSLPEPNSRIEIGIRDINNEVCKDDKGRKHNIHGLKHRVISLADHFDHEPSHPRQSEDRFHDDRSSYDKGDLETNDRNDRDHGVLKSMAVHDDHLFQSLGPG